MLKKDILSLNVLPLARELVAAVSTSKLEQEIQCLELVISKLLYDLIDGHSCSLISDISDNKIQLLEFLITTNIAANYNCAATIPAKAVVILPQDNLIYINRYLHYELNIVKQLKLLFKSYTLSQQNNDALEQLKQFSQQFDLPNIDQLNAIHTTSQNRLSFITGGPGTGKTTTVILLLWLFYKVYGENCQIRICAPTGRAATRVKESLQSSINFFTSMNIPINSTKINQFIQDGGNFSTIHKLLGAIKNNIYFKHNKTKQLDIDVLIVDESSMIGLPLFSKLVEAINCNTIKHVIFLGDKNQLSSVEEGFVFATMINILRMNVYSQNNNISELTISKRNSGDIGVFAKAILQSDVKTMIDSLTKVNDIKLLRPNLKDYLSYMFEQSTSFINYINYIVSTNSNTKEAIIDEVFSLFSKQITLCLTNIGPLGCDSLNQYIDKLVKQKINCVNKWYTGRPIIILENDYTLGLFNGDIGICIIKDDKVIIIFSDGKEFIPEILPRFNLAYALTIHKSQGSEYENVNVLLYSINTNNEMCSRELLYTAVTRAKKSVTIFADQSVVLEASKNITKRNTGLLENWRAL
ncbi:MAG: exodeoxyribonuclease V subunit alpha [Burkholderiales bacterium]|nr:exodeoxyribonuclease V subunit alpha [Burkholderiales bacterium]